MIARNRTLSIIRHLELLQPLEVKRGRGPLPKPQHPDLIAADYANAIRKLALAPAIAAAASIKREALRGLAALQLRTKARLDVDTPPHIKAELERAAKHVVGAMYPHELHQVVANFGKQTTAFQRRQLDRQVRHAMGVPLDAIERPIRDMIPAFTSANAELIKTIPDAYFERLRNDVEEAFELGMHPTELAERFVDADGLGEYQAERIARDQIGKLNAQVNRERQESIGVTRAVWRSMHDNRVCDDCAILDGEEFDWDDPPEGEGPGHCHPMDRCYAEPVFESADETASGDDEGDGGDPGDGDTLAA